VALKDWQALATVCGALIAFLTLVGLTWRWGIKPVWQTLRRLNEVADFLLGDKASGIPSLQDRLAALERGHADRIEAITRAHEEHMSRWHSPAPPNGPRPRVRRSP
jgi:hypothetical protein